MKKQLIALLLASTAMVNAGPLDHKNTVKNKSGLDLVFEARYLGGGKVHKQINKNAVGNYSKGAQCINEIVVFDMSGNQLYNHYIGGNKCSSHSFVIYNEAQPESGVKGKVKGKRNPVAPKIRVDW